MATETREGNSILEAKKQNVFQKALSKVFNKNDGDFTAERAWLETTYGVGQNLSIEERILNKQREIMDEIKSKFKCISPNGDCKNAHPSYRILIEIEEDIAAFSDEIMQPFIEKKFKVAREINKELDITEDDNVYIISWKNIFKKDTIYKKTDETK